MAKDQFPLPDGVDDQVLNRAQLARALDKTVVTVDDYVAKGMPVEEKGSNGQAYKFQLSRCWAWLRERDTAEAERNEAAERAVGQMRLALLGGEDGDSEQALSPKDRAALYESEHRYMQAAQLRGELVRRGDMVDLLERVFAIVRDSVSALPDRLARECGLSGHQIDRTITACDDLLEETRKTIGGEMLGRPEDEPVLEAAE